MYGLTQVSPQREVERLRKKEKKVGKNMGEKRKKKRHSEIFGGKISDGKKLEAVNNLLDFNRSILPTHL